MEIQEIKEPPRFEPRIDTSGMTEAQAFLPRQLDVQNQKMDWLISNLMLSHNMSVQNDKKLAELSKERWIVVGGATVLIFIMQMIFKK